MSDTELDWIYEAQEGEYFRVRDGRIEEYQTFTPSRRASYWYDYPATTSKTKNEQEWANELDYFGAYNQHRARKYADYYANYKGDFDF